MSKSYSKRYFDEIQNGSLLSAIEVIPLVNTIVAPNSVIDVGCGTGAWLSIWEKHGVLDILGVDGPYIQKEQLLFDTEQFYSHNLEEPLVLTRKFDLAMCLEVAEHIKESNATGFVDSLCKLSEVVLFSAAIPDQGGRLHYNEQYPQYWIDKFALYDFEPFDTLRPQIWENSKINACYRQNILLFVHNDSATRFENRLLPKQRILPLVHPVHFKHKEDIINSYQRILRTPLHAIWYFIKQYSNRLISIFHNGSKDGSRIDRYK